MIAQPFSVESVHEKKTPFFSLKTKSKCLMKIKWSMRCVCVCPAQIIKSKPQESDLKPGRHTWQLKFHKKETIPLQIGKANIKSALIVEKYVVQINENSEKKKRKQKM